MQKGAGKALPSAVTTCEDARIKMKFNIDEVKKIASSRFEKSEVFLVYLKGFRGYLFEQRGDAELKLVGIKRKTKGFPIRIREGTPVIVCDGEKYECKSCPDIQFISLERVNWEKAEARRYRRLSQEEILSYQARCPL